MAAAAWRRKRKRKNCERVQEQGKEFMKTIWMLANPKTNSNNGFPFYVPGALMRYASLIMLSLAMYKALK